MMEEKSSLRQLDRNVFGLVRMYHNEQPDDYPSHWHSRYEVIYPLQETYTAVIDGNTYEVMPGESLIIPAGVVHELFAPESGSRYIIMIETDVIMETTGLSACAPFFYPCVHLRMDQSFELVQQAHQYLREAIREYESGQTLSEAGMQAWIQLFLLCVGRYLLTTRKADEGERRHRMSDAFLDAFAYISDHCAEKLTLADMAARTGYSKYHFERLFKQYTGMSFYTFYMSQRMVLCKRLLANRSMPVTEVALRSGFGSIATFNRIFRQYEKMSPSEYRRLRQSRSDYNSNI